MSDLIEIHESNKTCPLDYIEDVLNDHNWIYDRNGHDEIVVDVAGKNNHYRLLFLWQPEASALQLCCQYDMDISSNNYENSARAIMKMNSSLWLGHFELNENEGTPVFRHTSLIRENDTRGCYAHIEDLVEICLTQCERFSPMFELLTTQENLDSQVMSLAMMETVGES